MKKVLISGMLLVCVIAGGVSLTKAKFSVNKSDEVNPKISASYETISGLNELKSKSDTIVEAEGTDKYELIDYKGVKMRKTTVKVLDVIKGDKELKALNFLQSEGVEGEEPLAKGEKVLMFLRKGVDITDSYVTFGGSQGVYKIVQSDNVQNVRSATGKSVSTNKHIEPHSMVNKKILKDLSGNYDDLKKKLAN